MSATGANLRALIVILMICLPGSKPAHSQSASSFDGFSAVNPSRSRSGSGAWLAKCVGPPLRTSARRLFSEGSEWPLIEEPMRVELSATANTDSFCASPAAPHVPRASASVHATCGEGAAKAPGVQQTWPCNVPADTVLAELSALGKRGAKIAHAREEVLKILRSENACAAWFRTKDNAPADTFQSLDFSLDLHGPQDIFASLQDQSTMVVRQPYVARATQDGGPHTMITINASGAFYRSQGQVQKTAREGGPGVREGAHLLTVGAFRGDTLPAQMVTLLHEFGHVIGLLPEDADDLDGKSTRNTDEVLRHCRSEIMAAAIRRRAQ
jgi:hypothetical protein